MKTCKCCEYEFTTAEQILILNSGYKVIFCPHCQIGFTCLTSEQKVERDYLNKRDYNLIFRLETYFGRKIEFSRRYEQSLSLIKTHTSITSALDIGCNIGNWLYFLKKKGITDITGIEINDECRNAGKKIFSLEICKNVQQVDRTFDLISFNDVLEHHDNPISFLTQTFPMAHAGTIYFIQLPNYQSKMAKWSGKDWPWWDVPDHLWHFSPKGISKLLEKAGMEILELRTCDVMYDLIEYILPQWTRSFMRLLRYIHRTSGYFYRSSNKGGLIQILAKRK